MRARPAAASARAAARPSLSKVAKNLLLGDEYSVTRKIKEAFLARRIEATLTKEQILELYLNQIFLGRNAYGVQAASRAYFDKDVDQLLLHEAAFLAVLPRGAEQLRSAPQRPACQGAPRLGARPDGG
jgi:membrane carboxypeptidase/penicillin-binding protein